MNLSFWEFENYVNNIDFIVVGAGIVGLSTAIELKNKFTTAKILVVDKSIVPNGASTKNAGFGCFGSPSELLSDLEKTNKEEVINLVEERVRGLEIATKRVSKDKIEHLSCLGYEVFTESRKELFHKNIEQLNYLNKLLFPIFKKEVFKITQNTFGFKWLSGIISIENESQLNPQKLIHQLYKICVSKNILFLQGIEVLSYNEDDKGVNIATSLVPLQTKKIIFCTNGFSHHFFPKENIQAARAQVLITKPLNKLLFKGNFHAEEGFYYFRNYQNRILLGGARNLALEEETTDVLALNLKIQNSLEDYLKTIIIPDTPFEIEKRWSGIMGVGKTKMPIIKSFSENVFGAFKLGGMGVALGSRVAQKVVALID